jgi:hypothetical protein
MLLSNVLFAAKSSCGQHVIWFRLKEVTFALDFKWSVFLATDQRSGFDSWRYHIFLEVMGLGGGSLSLVSTTVELLETKNSDSGLENLDYGHRDSSRWPSDTIYPQKLALTLSTSGGRLVGVVRLQILAMEFIYIL